MPAYITHHRKNIVIGGFPSDGLRSLPLLKNIPFSNNTNIRFGLKITLPHSREFQDIIFQWKLKSRQNGNVIKSGDDVLKIADAKASKYRVKPDKRDENIEVIHWDRGVTLLKKM